MSENQNTDNLPTIIIEAKDAIFWMDERGRWCNRYGPFENKKIIKRFNQAIRWDRNGFYVTQERDGMCEKVYFTYIETALLATDVLGKPPQTLLLNTGENVRLNPSVLYIKNDTLFMNWEDVCIRFSDRAMVKLARYLKDSEEGLLFITGKRSVRIIEI